MRRNSRKPRRAGWVVHSAFVPRRDGPRRLEQAFQILLDAGLGAGCIPATTDEDCNHESRRFDRGAGS